VSKTQTPLSALTPAVHLRPLAGAALAPLSRQVTLLTEQLDRFEQRRRAEAADAPLVDDSWDRRCLTRGKKRRPNYPGRRGRFRVQTMDDSK
jgi:hypothetical protein